MKLHKPNHHHQHGVGPERPATMQANVDSLLDGGDLVNDGYDSDDGTC